MRIGWHLKGWQVRAHKRPSRVEKSPKPKIHAATEKVLQQIWEAHAEVIAAFREASERLLGGDRGAVFPEGTFPLPSRCRVGAAHF